MGSEMCIRDRIETQIGLDADDFTKNLRTVLVEGRFAFGVRNAGLCYAGDLIACLLYTSDAADERSSVDLGGRRIIKKKNKHNKCGDSLQ